MPRIQECARKPMPLRKMFNCASEQHPNSYNGSISDIHFTGDFSHTLIPFLYFLFRREGRRSDTWKAFSLQTRMLTWRERGGGGRGRSNTHKKQMPTIRWGAVSRGRQQAGKKEKHWVAHGWWWKFGRNPWQEKRASSLSACSPYASPIFQANSSSDSVEDSYQYCHTCTNWWVDVEIWPV